MKGRPPKPDEIKILDGTWREHRDGPKSEVVQASGKPAMPEDLSGDAQAAWATIVPPLVDMGVAREIDATELGAMCEWYARYKKFAKALDKSGVTGKNARKLMANTEAAWRNFDRIAARFGLTASDRVRIKADARPKQQGVSTRKRG